MMDRDEISRRLAAVINECGIDNHLNLPDYVIAGFMVDALVGLGACMLVTQEGSRDE